MPETKTTRAKIARSQIDGSVCHTRFFTNSQDFDDDKNAVISLDVTNYNQAVLYGLATSGAALLMKQVYHGNDDVKTPVDALKLCVEFINSLADGTWKPGRGITEAGPDELEEAIMKVTGRSLDEVRDMYETLSQKPEGKERTREIAAAKRKLRSYPDVARALVEIEQRKVREASVRARKLKGEATITALFTPKEQAAE